MTVVCQIPFPLVFYSIRFLSFLVCVWSLYSFSLWGCFPSIFLDRLLWISVTCFIYYKNKLYSHNCEQNCGHGAHRVTTPKVLQYEITNTFHSTVTKCWVNYWKITHYQQTPSTQVSSFIKLPKCQKPGALRGRTQSLPEGSGQSRKREIAI